MSKRLNLQLLCAKFLIITSLLHYPILVQFCTIYSLLKGMFRFNLKVKIPSSEWWPKYFEAL